MKTDTTENQLTLKQEARAKLRESFLKAVNSLHGKDFIYFCYIPLSE